MNLRCWSGGLSNNSTRRMLDSLGNDCSSGRDGLGNDCASKS